MNVSSFLLNITHICEKQKRKPLFRLEMLLFNRLVSGGRLGGSNTINHACLKRMLPIGSATRTLDYSGRAELGAL